MIKPIPWYKFYSISDDWIIYYKWIEKKLHISKWYKKVNIWKKILWVHRLVALTYLWDIEWKVVMHIDDNPSNNNVNNLRIWTQKENMEDMVNKWRYNIYWRNPLFSSKEKEKIINSWLSTKDIKKIYWVHSNTILFWKKQLWIDTRKKTKYDIEFIKIIIKELWSNIYLWKKYWVSDITIMRRKRKYI